MTRFIQPSYPVQHEGLERLTAGIATLASVHKKFNATVGLSWALLAAVISALFVVANSIIDAWSEGHLLAAWLIMWLVGFAAIALFAGVARSYAVAIVAAFTQWQIRNRQKRSDAAFLEAAKRDPRIMAELQAAITRSQAF